MAKDRCPKCGVKRSPGYNLCFTCGYRFFGESQQKVRPKENLHEKMFPTISDLLQSKGTSGSILKCPQCKEEIPTGAKFCVKCGTKIEEKENIQEKSGDISIKNCINCGEELLTGAKFCFICGKKIDEMQPISSIREEKKDKSLARVCPKCGEELLEGAKHCFKCGIKIGSIPIKNLMRKVLLMTRIIFIFVVIQTVFQANLQIKQWLLVIQKRVIKHGMFLGAVLVRKMHIV